MKIVWFSEIKWDYLKTRKQQIISRKPADVQLLFLEPFVKGRRNYFKLRTEGDIFCATIPFVKSVPQFPWRSVLDRRAARSAVDFIARTRINNLLGQLSFDPPNTGFVISNIYAADIALSMPRRFLLYDCNDAHASFPGMRAWTETYFNKTTRNADAVFASSQALVDRAIDVRGSGAEVKYLGNGVDYSHFQNGASPRSDEVVRFGYLGAIAPWMDFGAIEALARRHPEWEIVLVGPVLHGVQSQLYRLTSLANVFHLEAVSYDGVPDVMRQFTVGLIPFKYNELTRGVNPNKLYEYFAVGLPVIATRFSEEVQRFPELVKAVDGDEAFVAAAEATVAMLADDGADLRVAQAAREVAQDNDWSVIADTFWSKVTTMMNA